MLKTKSHCFLLLVLFYCIFQSNEVRAEQAVRVVTTTATSDAHLSKKENITAQKRKSKRKKSFRFFKKLKKILAKEPSEKWLTNRALIFGIAAVAFFFIPGIFIPVGAILFSLFGVALILGIWAFAFSISSIKRGIRNWKNILGLILGAGIAGAIIGAAIFIGFIFLILSAL